MTYRIDLRETLAAMNTERQKLERRYRASRAYRLDALEWVSGYHSALPPELVEAIHRAYNESRPFRTVIDDAEAGEIAWLP